ncbi:MAG: ABC transporter substrate-binding protein [Clostridiales bacterium]|nr:ABC transporter substrate-binding protein [Clostridiales bacterium]
MSHEQAKKDELAMACVIRWQPKNEYPFNTIEINDRKGMYIMKNTCKFLFLVLVFALFAPASLADETVGVIQFATHPSLDNCYQGFAEGLGEGYAIDYQNATADMSVSDLQAKTMVSQGHQMLAGIATPSAMSCYAATRGTGIPVVFIAVSDPVAAGIVQSIEAPGGNCTGVSDVLNFDAQLQMIRAFLPEARTIGVIYTTSEPNSISHLSSFQEIAPKYGFTVEAVGITGPSEVGSATSSLVAKGVDCLNNFTDNNVVDNLPLVLHVTNAAGIPVFGSEVEQVVNGCLGAQGIDYVALGRKAGEIARDILTGKADPATTPVVQVSDVTPCYNSKVAEALGILLPDAFKDTGITDVSSNQ